MCNLLTARRDFDAWIKEGYELFEDMSHRYAAMNASYGAGLAAGLLDAEYSTRLSALHQLNTHGRVIRNHHLSPLLRLPSELLRATLTDASQGEDAESWIKLGHVCSKLRRILHDCQTIWAENACFGERPRDLDYFFHSVGNTPVILWIGNPRTVAQGLTYLYRARDIWTNQDAFAGDLLRRMHNTQSGFELLKSLTLDLEDGSLVGEGLRLGANSMPVVPHLNLPSLYTLKLFNVTALVTCLNLTELVMMGTTQHTEIYSPDEFLSMLRGCPRLRVLKLHNTLPSFDSQASQDNAVKLDGLQHLDIRSHRERGLSFWTHIRVPVSAEIIFQLERPPWEPGTFRGLGVLDGISVFQRHIRGDKATMLTLAGHRSTQELSRTLKFSLHGEINHIVAHRLTLVYVHTSPRLRTVDVARYVKDALDLRKIVHLAVGQTALNPKHYDAHEWRILLGLFPDLKRLDVFDSHLATLCLALQAIPDHPMTIGSVDQPSRLTQMIRPLGHIKISYRNSMLEIGALIRMLRDRPINGLVIHTVTLEDTAKKNSQRLGGVDTTSPIRELRTLVSFLHVM